MLLALNLKQDCISDKFFFGQLDSLEPQRSPNLRQLPYPPIEYSAWISARRQLKWAAISLALMCTSALPGGRVVKTLADAAISMWTMRQLFGYTTVAVTVASLQLVPDEVCIPVWDGDQ